MRKKGHKMSITKRQEQILSLVEEREYIMIIQELHRRNSNLKEDVNLQPKYEVSELIDRLLDGTYIDEVGEYTRIYPIKNCCKERLNIVKKKARKYEDNRFVSENK